MALRQSEDHKLAFAENALYGERVGSAAWLRPINLFIWQITFVLGQYRIIATTAAMYQVEFCPVGARRKAGGRVEGAGLGSVRL